MSQSRKTKYSRKYKNSFNKSRLNSQNSDSEEVFKKLDNLRTTVKKEHGNISTSNKKNIQLTAFVIIIIVGLSGVILLGEFNTPGTTPTNPGDKPPVLKDSIGGFQYDTVGTEAYNNGQVEVFYASGEFCPYCAIERWAVVMALSEFGTFSNLNEIVTPANEGSVPSYTFIGSIYESDKVNFQPVELLGLNSEPLESFTDSQQYLFDRYNLVGSIPFLLIGGTTFRIGLGSSFNYNDFSGISFNEVQSQINSKSGSLYNQIKIDSDYIVTIISQFLDKVPTTSSSTNV